MKTLLLFLSLYFWNCFVLRTIRLAITPAHPVFNTRFANVAAMIEYAVMATVCFVFWISN